MVLGQRQHLQPCGGHAGEEPPSLKFDMTPSRPRSNSDLLSLRLLISAGVITSTRLADVVE
jgi:hypothetical protein